MKAVRSPLARRAGFSFIEHLCALGVLSVGLVGLAGAVYVGVGQTQAVVDDTAAAAVARQAVVVLGRTMTRTNVGETGQAWRTLVDLPPAAADLSLADAVAGSQIATDPRYAWTAVYRRAENAPTAQVTVIVLRAAARPAFDARDLAPNPMSASAARVSIAGLSADGRPPPTLVPALVHDVSIEGDAVRFARPADADRLAPGATLVLGNTSDPADNGRVLTLGHPADDGRWELAPGQDAAGLTITADAYVVGRGYADPADPAQGFAGPNQVVAVYAAIVALQ